MKKPSRRKTRIDLKRLRAWSNDFSSYRHNVSEDRIRDWIHQFDKDNDLAARILDCIDYFTHDQIAGAFRSVLQGLNGWSINEHDRVGTWRFIAYSASAGESGDSMLHKFRHANNLASREYNELFIHRSDILRERLGKKDTVVLIDDFVGSGDQACDAWANQYGELLAGVGRVYLIVVAACHIATRRIASETGLELVPHFHLTEADDIFSSNCQYFNLHEKETLLEYCSKAEPKQPQGHGDCGLLVVFAHTCPNNSIPILHKSNKNWEALFRRYN